jgi:translation elongation factor EF-1beta
MPNRSRNYMDRILGRNEGSESRDFTDGRRYGEEQRFYDEEFNDSSSEFQGRNRPQRFRNRTYERDYRHSNPNGTARGFDYTIDDGENVSFRDRGFEGNDSFAPGDFRNTERTGIFNGRRHQDNRGGFFGKGPKGWKRSDERIKEEVSEALYRDYQIDASEIEVDVKDGVVTLSGTVDSRDTKRSAEECIENLTGVSDVHNRIRIADNTNVSNLGDKRALS